jgi:hypothetical protein
VRERVEDQVHTGSGRRFAGVVGVGLAAALVLSAGAAAPAGANDGTDARAASSDTLTKFGYRGDVYGVKLVTDSVEALNLKDAHAQQLCTRAAGKVVEQQSAVSVPDNPLIRVSASSSRTAYAGPTRSATSASAAPSAR